MERKHEEMQEKDCAYSWLSLTKNKDGDYIVKLCKMHKGEPMAHNYNIIAFINKEAFERLNKK